MIHEQMLELELAGTHRTPPNAPVPSLDPLDRLADTAHAVVLQKMSGTTALCDLRAPDLPEAMWIAVRADYKRIRSIWKAKIGRQRRWHYGWSAREALEKALAGGGL